MRTTLVAALGLDRAIGKDGDLLWHLPEDLKRFKALTTGHTIIMGRRTYASLPKGALPNRRNVVISRSLRSLPDAEVYPSLEAAYEQLEREGVAEAFVIGGGELYALPGLAPDDRGGSLPRGRHLLPRVAERGLGRAEPYLLSPRRT